jgi:MFS family permease
VIARARSLAHQGAAAYASTLRTATPNARRYLTAVALQSAGMGVLGTCFAIYVKTAGFSVTVVGNVEGALALAAGAVCLIVPPLVAVVGYRALFVAAALALGVARIAQVAGIGPAGIVAMGLVYGLGDGIMRSVGVAFLSENGPAKDRTFLFTIDFSLRIAASVVGALVGGLLPTALGLAMPDVEALRWTIALGGLLFVASAVPAYGIRDLRHVTSGRPWATYMRTVSGFRSWDRLWRLCVPEALISFGAGLAMPFVPLFLKGNHGATVAQIGLIMGGASVVMASATLLTPLLARRFGLVGTIVLTEVASLPFLLAIPLAPGLALVAALMWARSALMNMSWPVYNQIAVEGIPSRDKPLVVGWMSVAWSIAWFGGSVLGGRINEVSYTVPYFATATFYALGALASWMLLRGIDAERPEARVATPEVTRA